MLGSPPSRRKTAGHLAVAARARILVPNYRLAPEHPFPAAIHDSIRAYRWMLAQGACSTFFPIWVGAFPEANSAMVLIGDWIQART